METRAPQMRRLKTRQRLIDAAITLINDSSYSALRVEQVVALANVAKGTFFSHFEDKDRLMALLIGERMEHILSDIASGVSPTTVDEFTTLFSPLLNFMSHDRFVFDLVIRFSGATAIETTELISINFNRQVDVLETWIKPLQGSVIRDDVDATLLAEGFQAFAVQAMALKFCALHNSVTTEERMRPYIAAWLCVPKSNQ